jgi:unsaturated rhamnogalacturonyl hydrolase
LHPDSSLASRSAVAETREAKLERLIAALINNLVGIDDPDGAFLVGTIDGRAYDIKSWQAWDWTQGVGLYGLAQAHNRTADPTYLEHIVRWYKERSREPAPVKTINTMAPMYALAHLAEATNDTSLHPTLSEWAEWAMHGLPRTREGGFQHVVIDLPNKGQLWDDTLFMTAIPLARIGLLLGRSDYVEEAVRQFIIHAKYLTHRQSGLWFHGWSFETRNHLSAARWARGNSWVTMAIPDLLELTGSMLDGAVGLSLRETLAVQVEALASCQREDGLWPTLLDDPDSYGEASATAGFACGILKGVRLGLLDSKWRSVAEHAVESVIAQIDPVTGALGQVSFGTPIFDTLDEYRTVPLTTMPYGQAMAVLALNEALRG